MAISGFPPGQNEILLTESPLTFPLQDAMEPAKNGDFSSKYPFHMQKLHQRTGLHSLLQSGMVATWQTKDL